MLGEIGLGVIRPQADPRRLCDSSARLDNVDVRSIFIVMVGGEDVPRLFGGFGRVGRDVKSMVSAILAM